MGKLKILLLAILSNCSFAQLAPGEYTSTNKKAIRYLEDGRRAFEIKKDAAQLLGNKKLVYQD
jgi:hypothetical protein